MKRIKLGILQTNHDKSVDVGDAFPDDAHRFRDLFDHQEQRYQYRIYMTIGGELPQDINEQDAYLITGSPLSVLDEHVFSKGLTQFIQQCDAEKKKLVGACFGHQAIAMALGGHVERSDNGYNVGIESTKFSKQRSWMVPQKDSLSMHVFHEDQVSEVPPGCDLLGSSEHCKVASFAKGNHIFTTQAHPEFTNPFMNCVLGSMGDHLSDDQLSLAKASLNAAQDGSVFAAWCSNFYLESLS